jgi:hypothetical protein
MKKIYGLIVLTFLLFGNSCTPSESKINVPINDKDMIGIMTDIYLLDSHFANMNSYIKDSIVFLKFNEILKSYGYNAEQFNASRNYYQNNDKAYKKLQEGIRKSLEGSNFK